MRKIIVKASNAKLGKIQGTGAGTKHSEFIAKKVSKAFVLKGDTFLKMYASIDVKIGDTVAFVYA